MTRMETHLVDVPLLRASIAARVLVHRDDAEAGKRLGRLDNRPDIRLRSEFRLWLACQSNPNLGFHFIGGNKALELTFPII